MRLFVLLLSIACVVLYGYALAGYVGYSFDKGRPDYIFWGLLLGTFCGAVAIYLWKRWTHLFFVETEEGTEDERENKRDETGSADL